CGHVAFAGTLALPGDWLSRITHHSSLFFLSGAASISPGALARWRLGKCQGARARTGCHQSTKTPAEAHPANTSPSKLGIIRNTGRGFESRKSPARLLNPA